MVYQQALKQKEARGRTRGRMQLATRHEPEYTSYRFIHIYIYLNTLKSQQWDVPFPSPSFVFHPAEGATLYLLSFMLVTLETSQADRSWLN
jgi:hypothetical protein